MKAFEYAAPKTEAEALEMLTADDAGVTEVLAGGTDLVGLMKKMIITPDRVVNVMDVDSMQGIEPIADGGVRIGAATTLDEVLESPYLEDYTAIIQAIDGINSMQLQAQGTLGGEICQRPRCWFFRNGQGLLSADVVDGDNRYHAILGNTGTAKFVSSSRIGPALIALGAKVRIAGPKQDQERVVSVEDFFRTPRQEGQRETILEPKQLVTDILLPAIDGQTSSTYEVRISEGPDTPLASASVVLKREAGVVRDAQVVLGQVAPTPWVSSEARNVLLGQPVSEEMAEKAGAAAVSVARPLSENGYKVDLAKVAVKRAVLLAGGFETGGF